MKWTIPLMRYVISSMNFSKWLEKVLKHFSIQVGAVFLVTLSITTELWFFFAKVGRNLWSHLHILGAKFLRQNSYRGGTSSTTIFLKHPATMNNQQFRKLVYDTPDRQPAGSRADGTGATPTKDGATPALGSRMRSSIPMTP